ncbi:two-component system sensor histidine kinase [Salmonella sp. NCTC 11881]|nr:two-component system sensor histidine kinase [Salmonella sp. NCTC 11881]
MKLTQRLSLRVRLTLIFLILVSITWAISSFCGLEKDDG